MALLNAIGIESAHGLRTIELVCGDVTLQSCDLLAVSTFRGVYAPDPGTVVNAMKVNHGFSLEEAASAPALDLREPLGVWFTPPLKGLPFGRVICVEISGGATPTLPADAMQNLFAGVAVLEAQGAEIRTIAMPFLGTGNQRIDPQQIVEPLIKQACATLRRSETIEKISFIVLDPAKAEILSDELDRQLGAHRTSMPHEILVEGLLKDLGDVARQLSINTTETQRAFAERMRETVARDDLRPTDVGLLARQMAEVVADSFHQTRGSIDLYQRINDLSNRGISPWVVNYLHTLRVVGNEVIHIRERGDRTPPELDAQDVTVCLFCVLRVAQFWLQALQSRPR